MDKFATGIPGLDEITEGGLPRKRSTLIVGNAGCGKTLLMLSALVGGPLAEGGSAVFVSFEVPPEHIIDDAQSVGLELQPHLDAGRLRIEYIARPAEETAEVGEYSLEGLRLRIELALKATGAKYIAIDTIEMLFGMFSNDSVVRMELVRLLDWFRKQGTTVLMSAERARGQLTRYGLEEYVLDCVILLEKETVADIATRRLQVLKYRASDHGTGKYPFLIDSEGITIMPLTAARLDHTVLRERFETGIAELDQALGGGLRRGTTVLLSGPSGTGKTIFAATMVAAAAARGERAVLLSFEESPDELMENLRSAGVNLAAYVRDGTLLIRSTRPTLMGLERHLVEIYRAVQSHEPSVVAIDPVTSLLNAGEPDDVHRTIVRMIDFLKRAHVSTILTAEAPAQEERVIELNMSSILDAWIHLTPFPPGDDADRTLHVVKARGIKHDYRHVPFAIGSAGLDLGEPIDD